MTRIRETHWLVRAMCVILGAGAALGIIVGFEMMDSPGRGARVICAIFVLLYLATGAAAVGLWFGSELGLHATRLLLLLQIPFVQSASFTYIFYSGAIVRLYGGRAFGLDGATGSSFTLAIQTGSASDAGYVAGINLLAVACLVVLSRVTLTRWSSAPPPLPESAA